VVLVGKDGCDWRGAQTLLEYPWYSWGKMVVIGEEWLRRRPPVHPRVSLWMGGGGKLNSFLKYTFHSNYKSFFEFV
jgi:hypothetical protein